MRAGRSKAESARKKVSTRRWRERATRRNESDAGRGGLTQNWRTGTRRGMCGQGDSLQVFEGQQHVPNAEDAPQPGDSIAPNQLPFSQKDEPYTTRVHGVQRTRAHRTDGRSDSVQLKLIRKRRDLAQRSAKRKERDKSQKGKTY
jgi:hypothetical protein